MSVSVNLWVLFSYHVDNCVSVPFFLTSLTRDDNLKVLNKARHRNIFLGWRNSTEGSLLVLHKANPVQSYMVLLASHRIISKCRTRSLP